MPKDTVPVHKGLKNTWKGVVAAYIKTISYVVLALNTLHQ